MSFRRQIINRMISRKTPSSTFDIAHAIGCSPKTVQNVLTDYYERISWVPSGKTLVVFWDKKANTRLYKLDNSSVAKKSKMTAGGKIYMRKAYGDDTCRTVFTR